MSLETIPKIKCQQCGNSFPINIHEVNHRTKCPYCSNKLSDGFYALQELLDAAQKVENFNKDEINKKEKGNNPLQLEIESKEINKPNWNNI